MRVVGLDISLSSTGFADIDVSPAFGGKEPAYWLDRRSIRTEPVGSDLIDVHNRMIEIRSRIMKQVRRVDSPPSLVVVEGPSMGSVQGSHNISGNWWLIVDGLRSAGLTVLVVPPLSLKLYATGSGSSRGATKVTKGMVVKAVNERYEVGVRLLAKDNDQADAIVLAAIGARLLGHPIDPHIPAPNLRALTKIRLPEGLTT